MIYGLDLFSGIGGITKALEGYVRPIAYCENDRYAQAVLLSRQRTGELPVAPIWDDVQTLRGDMLPQIDIIYGGFPCQDISVAGRGAGLEGKRSGLFFEIARLVGEIRPRFIFMENVPAIRIRGGDVVAGELARLGYDCRWAPLSAADVGANHERERWWLLADTLRTQQRRHERQTKTQGHALADAYGQRRQKRCRTQPMGKKQFLLERGGQTVADSKSERCGEARRVRRDEPSQWIASGGKALAYPSSEISSRLRVRKKEAHTEFGQPGWWSTEPNVGRVAHGVPLRMDRLRGLGNAVVPAQAREAFERLIGLK